MLTGLQENSVSPLTFFFGGGQPSSALATRDFVELRVNRIFFVKYKVINLKL